MLSKHACATDCCMCASCKWVANWWLPGIQRTLDRQSAQQTVTPCSGASAATYQVFHMYTLLIRQQTSWNSLRAASSMHCLGVQTYPVQLQCTKQHVKAVMTAYTLFPTSTTAACIGCQGGCQSMPATNMTKANRHMLLQPLLRLLYYVIHPVCQLLLLLL